MGELSNMLYYVVVYDTILRHITMYDSILLYTTEHRPRADVSAAHRSFCPSAELTNSLLEKQLQPTGFYRCPHLP